MFEDYGIRVSFQHYCVYVQMMELDHLNKTVLFSQLPLLKALIDRLLQDGIEELLHVLSNSKKIKENTETSNVISENMVCCLQG